MIFLSYLFNEKSPLYGNGTGIKISQVVIVIAVIDNNPQIFHAVPDEHIDRLKEVINNYDTV